MEIFFISFDVMIPNWLHLSKDMDEYDFFWTRHLSMIFLTTS
jgi:hypothetical protein